MTSEVERAAALRVETHVHTIGVAEDGRAATTITVTTVGDHYVEVSAPRHRAAQPGDLKSKPKAEAPSGVLKAFVVDMSGSMYQTKLVAPLLARVSELAKMALAEGHEVVFIPWAFQAAVYVLSEANVDAVLQAFVEDRIPVSPASSQAALLGPWRDASMTPSLPFTISGWHEHTCPRAGLERLEHCVMRYKEDRGAYPASLQIVFSTDGEFSHACGVRVPGGDALALTDAFLRDLQQFFTNCQECPTTLIYIGVVRDHVPDAQKMLSAFPANHYVYVRDGKELESEATKARLRELFDETNLLQRLPVKFKGASRVTHIVLDETGRATRWAPDSSNQLELALSNPHAARRARDDSRSGTLDNFPLLGIRFRLTQIQHNLLRLQTDYLATAMRAEAKEAKQADAKGGKDVKDGKEVAKDDIGSAVLECDRELTALAGRLSGVLRSGKVKVTSAERDWTRELSHACARLKNLMRQYAASQTVADPKVKQRLLLAANQELKMAGVKKFNNAVAKQIMNNSQRLHSWRHTCDSTRKEDTQCTVFTVTVQVEDDDDAEPRAGNADGNDGKNRVFSCVVPAKVAHDQETEFITSESWEEIFRAGDTRCQCFLLSQKPLEIHFYTPSLTQVVPTNTHVALSTFYELVDRLVNVDGHNALFEKPVVGLTAAEKFNLALPLWSPNLEFAAKYRLKQLLGLIETGHPLGYTGRCADIYIPAILKMWQQFQLTHSSKVLNDTLLLMNAFRHIRKWFRVDNIADERVSSPADQVAFFLAGNSGSHAFSNLAEPLIHLCLAPPKSHPKPSANFINKDTKDAKDAIDVKPSANFINKDANKDATGKDATGKDATDGADVVGGGSVWARAERLVNREMVYGHVKRSGEEAPLRLVKALAHRVLENPQFAAEFQKARSDSKAKAADVSAWLVGASDIVKRALDSDAGVAKLLRDFLNPLLTGRAFDSCRFMIDVARSLPADIWQTLDRDYASPANLAPILLASMRNSQTPADAKTIAPAPTPSPSPSAARCATSTTATATATATVTAADDSKRADSKVDTKDESTAVVGFASNSELVAWIAFAQEYPSNAGRREVLKVSPQSDAAMLNVFMTAVRRVLVDKLSADEKAAMCKARFLAGRAKHGSTPLLIGSHERAALRELAHIGDRELFIKTFNERFKKQVDVSRAIFVDSKSGSEEEFQSCLTTALTNLYPNRSKLASLGVTGTYLPHHACSFMTCPEFLQPQPMLMNHLVDRGHDLPARDPNRCFVSGMHQQMHAVLYNNRGISTEDFVARMTEHAAQYVADEHIPRFKAIFKHSFPIVRSFYA